MRAKMALSQKGRTRLAEMDKKSTQEAEKTAKRLLGMVKKSEKAARKKTHDINVQGRRSTQSTANTARSKISGRDSARKYAS